MRITLQFLVFLSLVSSATIQAESFVVNNFNFRELQINGKNLESVVHSVHIDQKNRLWIGHEEGLSLYDGHGLKTFSATNPESGLEGGFTRTITESASGEIWFGNWGTGLYRFNEADAKPERIDLPEGSTKELFDNKIWEMIIHPDGSIWMATFTSGIFRFHPDTGEFSREWHKQETETEKSNRSSAITALPNGDVIGASSSAAYQIGRNGAHELLYDCESQGSGKARYVTSNKRGDIIVVCSGEVLYFRAPSRTPQRIDFQAVENADAFITARFMDDQQNALLGTASGTFHRVDLNSLDAILLPEGRGATRIPPSSIIWDIAENDEGLIVIGSSKGVFFSHPRDRDYGIVSKHSNHADMSLGETRGGWISRDHIIFNDANSLIVGEMPEDISLPFRFEGRRYKLPLQIDVRGNDALVTSTGQVIYSSEEGIFFSDSVDSEELQRFPLFEETSISLLMEIPIDGENHLFIGSFEDKLVSIPLPLTKASKPVFRDTGGLQPGIRHGWKIDDSIWVSGFDSLYRYSINEQELQEAFAPDANVPDVIRKPFGTGMIKVDESTLMFGTNSGAYYLDIDDSQRIKASRPVIDEAGLATSAASAIFRVDDNFALLITVAGIFRVDLRSGEYQRLLTQEVGINNSSMTLGRYHQDVESGWTIASGANGPSVFHPAGIGLDEIEKPMVITDIASYRDNQMIRWSTSERSQLTFTYKDRVIQFRFGLLDPISPNNNVYSLALEGFTDQWIEIGEQREFSFTNLDPGDYRLLVRGKDYIRNWSEPAELEFTVLPPWWQTWWAYTLYVILVVGSIVGYIFHLQRKLAREREISEKLREADEIKTNFMSELEVKVDEATADMRHAVEALEVKNVELEVAQHRAQDASRLKSEFLANMSHEIRTPMNGVLGFTQLLKKSELDTDQEEYVETLESSAHSLLGIINDILDLSKIEAGKLIIDNTGFNLRACATESIETLAPVAYEKNLELALEINADLPVGMRGDPVRIRQVMTNLTGNAIKFTDEGTISIAMRPARLHGQDALEIEITDTGRGITQEDREKLFKAFERGQAELASSATGTGLGLVITKKLTEAMGGEIELDSEAGKGTRVTLRLPLQPDRNPENRYEAPQPLLGKQVYLADANEASRAALHEQLRSLGAEVIANRSLENAGIAAADIVAIAISRQDADSAEDLLARARQQVGEDKPMLCFLSRTDRTELRQLGRNHDALCLPKIAHGSAQTRRIEDWLRGGERPAGAGAGKVDVPSALEGLEVIIADDNRINRFFLRKMLQAHGAQVHEAVNGNEALDLLTDDELHADIALIDLHMPEMDGLELAEKARTQGVAIPMLVVSANVLQETRDAARAAGFDDYILKPVEEPALLAAVRKHALRKATDHAAGRDEDTER